MFSGRCSSRNIWQIYSKYLFQSLVFLSCVRIMLIELPKVGNLAILFMWVRKDFVHLIILLIRFRWEERIIRSKSRPETWIKAVVSVFVGGYFFICLCLTCFTLFLFLSQVNKPCITLRWQNSNVHITNTTKELALRWRTIANQFIFPFFVTSGGPRPLRMHFLPVRGFLLVLCPSWVMDYLSAISQSNHIQRCSSSCAVCFKDDTSLHFLFGPPVLLLVFPPLTFNCSPFGFLSYTLAFVCICAQKSAF